MASVQDVIKDPNFLGLPHEEQRKVMVKLDQNFRGLPGPEQDKVLGHFAAPAAATPTAPAPNAGLAGPAQPAPMQTSSLLGGAAQDAEDAVPAAGKMIGQAAIGSGKAVTDAALFPVRAAGSVMRDAGIKDAGSPADRVNTTPTNTAQKVGYVGGMVGQLAIPSGEAATAVKESMASRYAAKVRQVVPEAAGLPDKAIGGAEKLFSAAAPTGTKTGFRESLYAAAPDLADIGRDVESTLKNMKGGVISPDLRIRATLNAIDNHMDQMYNLERAPQIQAVAQNPIALKLSTDADNALKFLSRTAGEDSVKMLATKARTGRLTVSDADQLGQAVNKELRQFESLPPETQAVLKQTTHAGGMKSLDQIISGGLNGELRSNGMPGIEAYEKAYANLARFRDQLAVRMNSSELQHPGLAKTAVRTALSVARPQSGIASASQAAVADVRAGKSVQDGLSDLSKTDITSRGRRPVWKLTSPAAPQATQIPMF